MILPLDTHAHIEPGIAPAELVALRSCVVAVTRTLDEYAQTRERPDPLCVWGAGCHPGLAREVKGFSASRMKDAIATTPVIGEVGLDGACPHADGGPARGPARSSKSGLSTPPGCCLSTATEPPTLSYGNCGSFGRTPRSCTGGWARPRRPRPPWKRAPTSPSTHHKPRNGRACDSYRSTDFC